MRKDISKGKIILPTIEGIVNPEHALQV